MEKFEKKCSLCRNSTDKVEVINDTTQDILDALSLKLTYDKFHEHFLCHVCFEKLCAALSYKSICLDTEDNIIPYIERKKELRITMEEIYKAEKELSEGQKICRLCMHIIKDTFIPLHQVDIKIMGLFLPEVNLEAVKDPVVCKSCYKALDTHNNFIKMCLSLQETLGNNEDRENKDVSISQFTIKHEDIHIKYEPVELDQMEVMLPNESEAVIQKTEPVDDENEPLTKKTSGQTETRERSPPEESQEKEVFVITTSYSRNKYRREIEAYTCRLCRYETKYIHCLLTHLKTHKDSKLDAYKCTICGHKQKLLSSFQTHMMKHPEYSQNNMNECNFCNYKSKYRANLRQHMKQHREPHMEEKPKPIPLFQCNTCTYKSRKKQHYLQHLLVHKKDSEVELFECFTCRFRTKRKKSLVQHIKNGVCTKNSTGK